MCVYIFIDIHINLYCIDYCFIYIYTINYNYVPLTYMYACMVCLAFGILCKNIKCGTIAIIPQYSTIQQ